LTVSFFRTSPIFVHARNHLPWLTDAIVVSLENCVPDEFISILVLLLFCMQTRVVGQFKWWYDSQSLLESVLQVKIVVHLIGMSSDFFTLR